MFTDGTFGERVAAEFPDLVIEAALDELIYQLGLLRTPACGGRPELPPVLSEAGLGELETFRRYAAGIVHDAKKRNSRGPFRRGGKPDADGQDARS